jgi:hypothetical protein
MPEKSAKQGAPQSAAFIKYRTDETEENEVDGADAWAG